MKVTYLMRPDGCLFFGGAEVQGIETANAVRRLGVDVEILTPLTKSLGDVVHAFGPYDSYWSTLHFCKNNDIPFALSTIFFKQRSSTLMLLKERFRARRRHNPMNRIKRLMREASVLLPNTEAESEQVRKIFLSTKTHQKMTVIPNGAEERFAHGDPELFRARFDVKEPFVLNIARIEKRKNQLNLIRAAKSGGFNLIIIGKDLKDDYSQRCKNEAKDCKNIRFLDPIAHDDPLLASAYAAAKVFALPSTLETPGIAAIEAGLAGARIVVTPVGGPTEYFQNFAYYPDINSSQDIDRQIQRAWNDTSDAGALQKHLLENYTWDAVARKTLRVYEELLREKESRKS